MASIRDTLCRELVGRLALIRHWEAQLRSSVNEAPEARVLAIVGHEGETKQPTTSETYECLLPVTVAILAKHEDADRTIDDGNAFRYLDRMVVLAERAVHVPEDYIQATGNFINVLVDGHTVEDPDNGVDLAALLRVTFRYRHSLRDPEQ